MSNQPPQHILDKINGRNFSTYKLLSLIRETPELDIETDAGWSWLTWNGIQIEGTGDERFTSQSEIDDLLYMAIGDGLKEYVQGAIANELESIKDIVSLADAP
jgi:hypothetical protein